MEAITTTKIEVKFRRVADADRFKERLEHTRPLGYQWASRCFKNRHPVVFVTGQFTDEQAAYIRKLNY